MPRPAAPSDAPLARYQARRDFAATPEPAGRATRAPRRRPPALSFVIQKHWASRLHYDFRLEWNGVLLSWAVPKGPSYDPAQKRMAVQVEAHPLDYGGFEGEIPKGHYGAGSVIVWDRGSWEPVGDVDDGLAKGKLVFALHGEKLAGLWELVRIARPGEKQPRWILFKKRDAWARPLAEYDVLTALPDSVVGRPLGAVEQREPRGAAEPKPAKTTPSPAAVELSTAPKAPQPRTLEPQLATLASSAPEGGDWIVETKFDGYRLLARIDARGSVRLVTRNGNDWTDRLCGLADAIAALGIGPAWLDGEIVVLGDDGIPDFNLLQNAIDGHRNDDIVYFAFDLPWHAGRDLRRLPLRTRRAALAALFDGLDGAADARVRLSVEIAGPPAQVLQAACNMKMEGVIVKRADAPYAAGRSESWLKLKCALRQEFVIVGYTDRASAPNEVGALLLAYHDDEGRLRSAGSVGTGWNAKTGRELHALLAPLRTDRTPLAAGLPKAGRWSRRAAGSERWVRPELVAEVSFGQWTPDGVIRHASFKALRSDKPAAAITRERAAAPTKAGVAPGIKVTHGERVVDASTGLTKLDLVRYYESIAEWMLPHLRDRPVSLVRAPDGIGGPQFFQKHPETRMPGLTTLDAALWPGHAPLLAVDSAEALAAAAQMNVIEFHTWNSTTAHIDRPDRIVFDLDPGEGVTWPQVQEAALLLRAMLDELALESWLKTSGGKGLHVVVPIAPKLDDDAVKACAQAVVRHMAQTIPERFVARAGAANRVGRIFIDYLRNGRGQTTVAAFSARARPGLGVSMPVGWEQLGSLKSAAHWTISTARDHLSLRKVDPWADYAKTRQTLAKALRTLERL
jgi:bifunctional non-homologous end joining protein LigD